MYSGTYALAVRMGHRSGSEEYRAILLNATSLMVKKHRAIVRTSTPPSELVP